MPESSDSMYSFIFMLQNIWYHHFTRSRPNSQETVNFIPNMGPRGTKLNWSKIHNFLWIRFTLGKIMISYDFYLENREIHGIWAYWHFSSKTGFQKYSACVPGELTPSCFCSMMSFSEKTYRLSEPDCYTLVFSLLNSILVY